MDTSGPTELLKGESPIFVHPGAAITFIMDYDPHPNQLHVEQFTADQHSEVQVTDNTLQAPVQKGIYYYSYGVWWMDEKEANVAHGDAFYSIVIEVK